MLKLLFGSALRAGLIQYFVQENPGPVAPEVLARRFRSTSKKIVTELASLETMGFIERTLVDGKKTWVLNRDFTLLPEFKSLIYKSLMLMEKNLASSLATIKGVQLLILTGIFNGTDVPTDIFLVGSVDKAVVQRAINKIAGEFQDNLRFTIFSKQEYVYRRSMTDKFVYQVLNLNPIIVVNKLNK
ncbi:MAG: hypothetical protein V1846_05045 [Candidatus Komeilibacteria bacterium]